jgi:hypothetical protein
MADAAYYNYISHMSSNECLGWEIKVKALSEAARMIEQHKK